MDRKETVFITGATGFIGSHLVELLLERGHSVRCAIRASSDLKWIQHLPVKLIETDLRDVDSIVEAMGDASYVLHVAGIVKARATEGYMKGNVALTESVLNACLKAPQKIKKVVVISSLAASAHTLPGHPVDENTPSAPVSSYGISKVAQEKLCATYFDRLPISIIRPPGVYGPRDTEILIFFKTMSIGLLTEIGLSRKTVSLVYVKDLVQGIYQAMIRAESAGQTYFLADPKEYDWDEIGRIAGEVMEQKYIKVKVPHFVVFFIAAISEFIAKLQGKASTLNLEKAREITKPSWTCSPAKAMKEIDFKPVYKLKAGFEETVSWYVKKGWL